VSGIADLRIQQVYNYPQINVDVDRTLAAEVGLTQRDVANSLLVTLSGSGQVKPNFWLNSENGVSYPIVAQMPQYRVNSISDLSNIPITSSSQDSGTPLYLGGLAQITVPVNGPAGRLPPTAVWGFYRVPTPFSSSPSRRNGSQSPMCRAPRRS
jgi:multidrug efflux pump subunit AcrB